MKTRACQPQNDALAHPFPIFLVSYVDNDNPMHMAASPPGPSAAFGSKLCLKIVSTLKSTGPLCFHGDPRGCR